MALHAGNLALLGGELCLDFVNTVEYRGEKRSLDFLHSYADLIAWSRHTGLLTNSQAQRLHRETELPPTAAIAVLEQAIQLRETLYQVFVAVLNGRSVDEEALARVNTALSQAFARLQIQPQQGGFAWDWDDSDGSLARMLWPILRSAAALLTGGHLDRLGQCPSCHWLFFDSSRSHSRRWCDMRVCGNRAKARRHYALRRR